LGCAEDYVSGHQLVGLGLRVYPSLDHGGSENFPPAADQPINQSNQPKTSLQFHHRLRYQVRLATRITAPLYLNYLPL